MQYKMLQNNTYERLAIAIAKAINGLPPKINVWHTGNQSGEGGADADPICEAHHASKVARSS